MSKLQEPITKQLPISKFRSLRPNLKSLLFGYSDIGDWNLENDSIISLSLGGRGLG
jgi:hypothetical protein